MYSYICTECPIVKECPSTGLISEMAKKFHMGYPELDAEKFHSEINLEYVGLENDYNENNCFANSALQAL